MKKIIYTLLSFSLLFNFAYAVDEFTLHEETKFNPTFENRYSFSAGINPSMINASDINHFNISYNKKMEDFWFEASFLITSGVFNKITTNNYNATGLSDSEVNDQKNSLTTFGIGVARESRYSESLIPIINNLYEVISADFTYNIMKEKVSAKTFSGPGLIAKFSLFKKLTNYVSLGPQLLYNLSVIKRAQELETETSSQRSLTLSYLTIGFDLSFYL